MKVGEENPNRAATQTVVDSHASDDQRLLPSSSSSSSSPSSSSMPLQEKAFGDYAHLVFELSKVSDESSVRALHLKEDIRRQVERLVAKSSPSKNDINALIILAGARGRDGIYIHYQEILKKLYDLSSHDLGHPEALAALAQIILFYGNKNCWMTEKRYKTILEVFFKQAEPELNHLVSLNYFLEAMLWAGVKGIRKEDVKTPFLDMLEKFAATAKKQDNISLYVQAKMAWQALRRVDSDEEKSHLFLRKGIAFAMGVKNFSMAMSAGLLIPVTGVSAGLVVANVIEGSQHFYEAFHKKGNIEKWYVDVQNVRQLLMDAAFTLRESITSDVANYRQHKGMLELKANAVFAQIRPEKLTEEKAQLCAIDLLTDLLQIYQTRSEQDKDNIADGYIRAKCLEIFQEYCQFDQQKKPSLVNLYAISRLQYLSQQGGLSDICDSRNTAEVLYIQSLDKLPEKEKYMRKLHEMNKHSQQQGQQPELVSSVKIEELSSPSPSPSPSALPLSYGQQRSQEITYQRSPSLPPISSQLSLQRGQILAPTIPLPIPSAPRLGEEDDDDIEMQDRDITDQRAEHQLAKGAGGTTLFADSTVLERKRKKGKSKKMEGKEAKKKKQLPLSDSSESTSSPSEHESADSGETSGWRPGFNLGGQRNTYRGVAEDVNASGQHNQFDLVQGKKLSEQSTKEVALQFLKPPGK